MQICLNLAFKSYLFDRPPYKRESALLFWHIATKLKVSSNYIAASVNTDYNEALIVLKVLKETSFNFTFCTGMTSQFIVASLVFHCSNVHFGVSFSCNVPYIWKVIPWDNRLRVGVVTGVSLKWLPAP